MQLFHSNSESFAKRQVRISTVKFRLVKAIFISTICVHSFSTAALHPLHCHFYWNAFSPLNWACIFCLIHLNVYLVSMNANEWKYSCIETINKLYAPRQTQWWVNGGKIQPLLSYDHLHLTSWENIIEWEVLHLEWPSY